MAEVLQLLMVGAESAAKIVTRKQEVNALTALEMQMSEPVSRLREGSVLPEFLEIGGRPIAIERRAGRQPGLVWLGGFRSDMQGSKAMALDRFGAEHGLAVTRFDYSGHGQSGGDFNEGTISRWLEEALAVFDTTSGPQIVIGSSMGGWLALLLIRELRRRGLSRVMGLALIAPATDMEIYGVSEYWTLPKDRGDCEDYALLKQKLLIERGWPQSSMLLTVVKDDKGEGHAVLTARTSQGDFILDNKSDEVRIWYRSGYEFVMRQSYVNPRVWVGLDPTEEIMPGAMAGVPAE